MEIYIYIYIYIYICVFLEGFGMLFSSGRHYCSTLPPDVGALGSNTPIVDNLFGTGRMDMFVWTMGSFYVFGKHFLVFT